MYAIVRAGGRQEKVAVGDVVTMDRVQAEEGDSLTLTPVLVVDGGSITSGRDELDKFTISAEVVGHGRGEKIRILRYKNKTGYRRRQGARADLTTVKITGISSK